MTGKVEVYYAEKGYGFLRAANYVRHFFHISDLAALEDALPVPGEVLEFEPQLTPKGLKAVKIRRPR